MLSLLVALLLIFQEPGLNGAKLERMVQERDQLHAEWKASESKKSGIFGNRTKKDMIETNEWLERILAKDNQIMDELRMIGTIETTTISQEKDDYKSITLALEQDVQALKRAVAERDKEIENKLTERRAIEWALVVFFLSTLGLGYWIYKLKKG
ncbi:Clp protease ClpB [Algoriphagus sp. H41]|uniref:Clp protease ClpB n=1 Tax=Algoriphagus oliviformis TaxID=2811231 RepID=A0ABS3C978_9BACT|nr:Clp protease ClpB [Algoriphagus oliviformis]MBN7813657.1 Clp protease ClpB [Algoriphagus oliviformis]